MKSLVKVHVMHTGEVKVDRALPFEELGEVPPVNVRGEEFQIWLPMSSYLIEHPKGRIVVDSGWHEEVRTNPLEHLGAVAHFVEYRLSPGASIREQLTSKGLSPKDIDLVIISHLDVDHISGLKLLDGAKRFYVSDIELKHVQPFKKRWYEGLPLETFEFESIPHGPYGLGKDLFGDGLVYLVFTPGHTAGQVSVLIRLESEWLLLASDVGYSERSWKELLLPGITVSQEQAIESLKWVHRFSQRDDCLAALANHDPAVQPNVYG
ncbi:N-acyl homoserine lactonase family protein [Paenibacillus sp. GSMTC-2017]|uniref:N-acyl homoserine lactonase family protein n=1 Tax=Paenibacillus sp. GSMTC-2017 TaxID=2794350 RepID=UPI001E59553D|nr:N-acyl homoserine lactonase family protein [Paenibacillus sp. GSMTC-2017]